jgi:phage shock protein C
MTMSSNERPQKLYRSRRNRYIAGVCGGIAEYFGVDPTLVRLLTLLSILIPGPQFILYIVAWIVIPEEPTDYTQ